jgi:G3E family GTPase
MEHKSKIKVDIISGFLGAGKTTFIKKMISEGFKEERIFVLENEFGKVGIDGAILESSNIIVKELRSGCICCSPLLDFMNTLMEESEAIKPTRIIIEPTGVAKLTEVMAQLMDKGYEDLLEINIIATIVDVKKYKNYNLLRPEFLENQIRATRNIILSKVDTASEIEISKTIEAVKSINPKARIISDKWEDINTEDLIEVLEGRIAALDNAGIKRPSAFRGKSMRPVDSADSVFTTFEVEVQTSFEKEKLLKMLEDIGDEIKYGIVLRGKGILQDTEGSKYRFDYVSGDVRLEEFSGSAPLGICFIGIDLNKSNIENLLNIS